MSLEEQCSRWEEQPCKGPEAGCSRDSEEASVAGVSEQGGVGVR